MINRSGYAGRAAIPGPEAQQRALTEFHSDIRFSFREFQREVIRADGKIDDPSGLADVGQPGHRAAGNRPGLSEMTAKSRKKAGCRG
jgi:hypothetical protein